MVVQVCCITIFVRALVEGEKKFASLKKDPNLVISDSSASGKGVKSLPGVLFSREAFFIRVGVTAGHSAAVQSAQ